MFDFDIQLFAEGGGEASAASEENGVNDTGVNNADGTQPQNTGDIKNVDAAHQNGSTADAPSFNELINGQYKDEYKSSVEKIVKSRIGKANKQIAELSAEKAKQSEILERLCNRYGVSDTDALSAILDDPHNVEDIASQQGMSAEVYLELERLRTQKNALERAENQRREAEKAQQSFNEAAQKQQEQVSQWLIEAAKVKAVYPDFDLSKELENPDFRALVSSKNPEYAISMIQAYRMIHFDELSAQAADSAAKAVTDSVAQRKARPSENGLGTSSGVAMGRDVSRLTKKERADIARRAMRGETITLK